MQQHHALAGTDIIMISAALLYRPRSACLDPVDPRLNGKQELLLDRQTLALILADNSRLAIAKCAEQTVE